MTVQFLFVLIAVLSVGAQANFSRSPIPTPAIKHQISLDPVEPRGNLKKLMGDFASREETGGSPPQRLVLGSMLVNLSAWDLDVLFKGLRKC